jgi:FkbM family methyltransferase
MTMRPASEVRHSQETAGESTLDLLQRTLKHPDPPQLFARLQEVVRDRTYLQHGVSVNEGDVVLDVGANVGVAAAFFATECRAGVVHSFEPVGPIFELLRENLRSFPGCVPHDYGLSSERRTGTITYYPKVIEMSGLHADPVADRANLRRFLLNMGGTDQQVDAALDDLFSTEVLPCELRTVSEVLRDEAIERVDLLKLDVEKAELEVLAGIADEDWSRIRQISGELHLDAQHRDQLAGVLRDRGFAVTVVQDPSMRGTPAHMFYAVRD